MKSFSYGANYSRRTVKDPYYFSVRKGPVVCKDCVYFQHGMCTYMLVPVDTYQMRVYGDLCGPTGKFFSRISLESELSINKEDHTCQAGHTNDT